MWSLSKINGALRPLRLGSLIQTMRNTKMTCLKAIMPAFEWLTAGIPATPENLRNTTPASAKDRDGVTLNVPLEPWGKPFLFHKFLGFHIHNATRLAGDNDGMASDAKEAARLDLPPINEAMAQKVGGR
jgi:hypothetical protein